MDRDLVEAVLRDARQECLHNGHEWDVADAMAALERVGLIPSR